MPCLIVCIDQRLGSGQRPCADSGNLGNNRRIRQMLLDADLDVPVIERERLGHRDQGPVMRIAPVGRFFTEIDDSSLPRIVDALRASGRAGEE